MSGRLVILRHAKAEHGTGGDDHARRLTGKGRAQARAVGLRLAEAGLLPDLAICSTAARTRETLELALGEMPDGPAPGFEAEYEDAAYAADVDTLFDLVNAVPREVGTLLLVGHNPAVAQLASAFVDGGTFVSFPPASVAVVSLEVDWLYAAPGTGSGYLLEG
ncbi:SixA phosphatase family protein [Nocardiopsis potens]|uniref:SixA phosphatase family protein n=1 Tax=Nocardiopsis potens TaxID=1246458 RepID=UPI00036EB506|nr:histidine phosphatase family protein [Nocardiopsis potens]